MEDLIQTNYALDTFYLLVTGALVMFMAPGFAMLEAGMVRAKNTTEILTKNVALFGIACIMYMLCGYAIMYPGAGGEGAWLPLLGLGIGAENSAEGVIAAGGDIKFSARSDYFFQVVFVATAMSIVSGAVAERMKLWAFLAFAVVMTGFIYPVQGFWKWGGGGLQEAGFLDFAGSGVVHLSGATAALAGVILLGARAGKYTANGQVHPIPGANMPLATLGMFILWFGWFGFNGGSELKISDVGEANAVAQIFANTNIAACGGLVTALILARALFGKADLTMALNGALAGLVSITAEPLTPSIEWAAVIGAVGGALVIGSIVLLDKLRLDDPVGAISVHGTCGVWGLLAVCITNPDSSIVAQLLGIGAIFVWTFVMAFIVWFALKKLMGIRISQEEEYAGADISETGIEAYPEFAKG